MKANDFVVSQVRANEVDRSSFVNQTNERMCLARFSSRSAFILMMLSCFADFFPVSISRRENSIPRRKTPRYLIHDFRRRFFLPKVNAPIRVRFRFWSMSAFDRAHAMQKVEDPTKSNWRCKIITSGELSSIYNTILANQEINKSCWLLWRCTDCWCVIIERQRLKAKMNLYGGWILMNGRFGVGFVW